MIKKLCVLALWISLTFGYRRFRGLIPNGFEVRHPCPGGGIWEAVGHMSPSYVMTKNAFGQVRNRFNQLNNTRFKTI